MALRANGPNGQGFVPTHEWKSKNYDWPVALTGRAWHDDATDRDFVEVVTDDGKTRPVPKDELVIKATKRAKQATPKAGPAKLSPADAERLKTWLCEIAEEALGDLHQDGDGSFRFGQNRGLIIHPSGFWYDFTSDRGGSGGVDLLALLHGLSPDDAVSQAHEWLKRHDGFGSLIDEIEEQETSKAAGDAERVAFVNGIWARTTDIKNTASWTYLTAARGLSPIDDDLEHIRWLPHARGLGPDAEGAMVVALINNSGGLEALQLTYITSAGVKSAVQPCRRTYKGPHDWGKRGLLRLGRAGNAKAFIVEGIEDALTLRQAGADRVLALCGLGRLGRVDLPFEVETVAVVRDADGPEANGTATLWRGVVRLICKLHSQGKVLVTTRPDVVGHPAPNKPIKDANDLLRYHGVEKVKALMESAQRIPPFSEFERKAIIEAACEVDNASYASGRDRIAMLLEWRKSDVDKARKDRIKERANANQAKLAERDTPWPDPVFDVAPLLDEIVAEISRYVVASSSVMHAVALWIAFAHLVQREDLEINISPRLAIQAPDTDCGKTVLLEAVACGVPRPDMLVSISASSLFRSVDADKNTLLIDEVDMLLDEGRNPDLRAVLQGGHRRSSAKVKRTERLTDGSFDPRVYNCFTAIATAGIGALPRTLQNRAIVAFLQRAMACEVREHLVNAESETLIVIRRRLMRWADDLRELPDVDRPRELANRLGDNWHPLRRIAALAGGEWPARAWEAAVGPAVAPPPPGGAMTELLDAVWRVFEASKLPRMLTVDIVTALLDLDEGKWRQVKNGGKAVDEYYLRDRLKDVLPRSKEADKARRWRTAANPSGNRQWGYTLEHHLKEPFLRYLGKGSPLDAPKEAEEETEKGEEGKEGKEGERAGGEPADVKTPASTAPRKGQGLDLRALDLFCCAGGVTKGLQQAGFHVTGVDISRQPNYCGDDFVLGDALEFLRSADLSQFAYITASPPCQAYSVLRHAPGEHRDADLIGPTREALIRTGLPYVIENVEGARDRLINPIILCGSMFGLKTPDGAELYRHRLFEASFPLVAPSCRHRRGATVIGIYGGHFRDRRRPTGGESPLRVKPPARARLHCHGHRLADDDGRDQRGDPASILPLHRRAMAQAKPIDGRS